MDTTQMSVMLRKGLKNVAYKNVACDDNTTWYLDTGASNHMCGYKHFLKEMREVKSGHVSFEDASKIHVKGKDTIFYLQANDAECSIEDVYYVSDLKSNILRLGQHFKIGATHGEGIRNIHERLVATIEG